jgi:hypothetical protein
MERYQALLNQINSTSGWSSDERFFIDVITKSTIKLIELCYGDLDNYCLIRIFPILRQVQENCIALIGFGESVLSAKEFYNKKCNPQVIFKRLSNKASSENIDPMKIRFISEYLQGIKDLLNNYSHTNIDGLMQLFIEEYQVYEAKKFNRLIIKFLMSLTEGIFISISNSIFKISIDLPEISNFNKELKDIGSLRYIADKLPDHISKYIKQSELLNDYYRKLASDFKKLISEFKQERNNLEGEGL